MFDKERFWGEGVTNDDGGDREGGESLFNGPDFA